MSTVYQSDIVNDTNLATAVLADRIGDLWKSSVDQARLSDGDKIIRLRLTIPEVDPLLWLDMQKDASRVYWAARDSEFETAGVGVADYINGDFANKQGAVFSHIRGMIPADMPDLRYFGGFRFSGGETLCDDNPWCAFGESRFVLPRFELCRRSHETNLVCNLVTEKDLDCLSDILTELEAITFLQSFHQDHAPKPCCRRDLPGQDRWRDMATFVLRKIDRGELAKVALARETTFEFSKVPRPFHLLHKLRTLTSECFHFGFQFGNETAFLGASPERLYRRNGRRIKTEALAATRPRGKTVAEDIRLEQELLETNKELTEQQYVADSIANTLGRFCRWWHSDNKNDSARVLKLASVQHLITRFEGELAGAVGDSEILDLLHPTPAVAGQPIPKAVDVIGQLEPFDRGWYAGPVGWVGKDAAEFAVAIRSGLLDDKQLRLYSGAGIVKGSRADEEWDEIESKLGDFIASLEQHD
ncbi:MAG: isochorismate synthase [candidate division Zixibacteria bacterium]|nr:isochorismate synthase [candidate division Zixibacteria bacterium]